MVVRLSGKDNTVADMSMFLVTCAKYMYMKPQRLTYSQRGLITNYHGTIPVP